MTDHAVSTGVARYTTAHKLSVLRAQDAKVQTVLKRLQEQPISQSKEQTKSELIETIKQKLEALREVSDFFSQKEQLKLIKDTETFLAIAQYDPGVDTVQCISRSQSLDSTLERTATQSRLAVLFCDVLQQWLDTDGRKETDIELQPAPQAPESQADREKQPSTCRTTDLQRFLQDRGLSIKGAERLETIRKNAAKFGQETLRDSVKPEEVSKAMKRLSSDPRWMTEELRVQVKEEATKTMALEELASAYTFSLRNIGEWEWPSEGILAGRQRHINGKERECLNIDVQLSVFLEVVSVRWIDHLQPHLAALHSSVELWPKSTILDPALSKIPKGDIYKFNYTIDTDGSGSGKWLSRLNKVGLTRLFEERQQAKPLQAVAGGMTTNYEGVDDHTVDSSGSAHDEKTSFDPGWTAPALAAKTARAYSDVFKMLCTDIKLLQEVSPDLDITAVHLDIKDFGPSMPHAVSLAVFEFFGAPTVWLEWLKVYLEIPIRDAQGVMRKAQKGSPFGQGFSSLINELLLIILDMAVAIETSLVIQRNHDDFWFWSQDQEKVIQAWVVLQDFAKLTGLEWNETKSGCRVVSTSAQVRSTPAALPQTPFRWGYLNLEQNGEWTVDTVLVESCIQDARAEIRSAQSLLGKINVWNKYQAFLLRNTSMPLNINGIKHLERLQQVIGDLQLRITDGGSMLDWLKNQLYDTFPNFESLRIPDAMYFWPLNLGGFELHSQLITMQTHIEEIRRRDDANTFPKETKFTWRVYEALQSKWQSPDTLKSLVEAAASHDSYQVRKWATELASTSDEDQWPGKTASDPAASFIRKEDFLLCNVATEGNWQSAYQTSEIDISTVVVEKAYREANRGIYRSSLEAVLGQATRIVPAELVPKYALHDLQRAVKQLYK